MKTPIADLSDAGLVDRWGDLQARAKASKGEIEQLQAEFDRRKLTIVAGERWGVIKTQEKFPLLDIPAIRAEMGRDWCSAHEKPGGRTLYKFAEVAAPAAPPEPRKRKRA